MTELKTDLSHDDELLFLGWLERHAEAQPVSIRIGHGKFSKPPSLIYWRGVDRGFRAQCRVQPPSTKRHKALITVFYKYAVNGTEDAVA